MFLISEYDEYSENSRAVCITEKNPEEIVKHLEDKNQRLKSYREKYCEYLEKWIENNPCGDTLPVKPWRKGQTLITPEMRQERDEIIALNGKILSDWHDRQKLAMLSWKEEQGISDEIFNKIIYMVPECEYSFKEIEKMELVDGELITVL